MNTIGKSVREIEKGLGGNRSPFL